MKLHSTTTLENVIERSSQLGAPIHFVEFSIARPDATTLEGSVIIVHGFENAARVRALLTPKPKGT